MFHFTSLTLRWHYDDAICLTLVLPSLLACTAKKYIVNEGYHDWDAI